MNKRTRRLACAASIAIAALMAAAFAGVLVLRGDGDDGWPSYGHDPGGGRFSPLTQVNAENVQRLEAAWVFHTGDVSTGEGGRQRSAFESTPLEVDGTLYVTTPFNKIIALDP